MRPVTPCEKRNESGRVPVCTALTEEVGAPVRVSSEVCERCGGWPNGKEFREKFVSMTLSAIEDRLVGGPDVARHLASRLEGERREDFVRRAEAKHGPLAPDQEAPRRGLIPLVTDYARSLASGRTAGPAVVRLRQLSCFGFPGVQEPCPALRQADGHWFCNECGCGERTNARLDTDEHGRSKLQFGYVRCPRKREGFSNGPANTEEEATARLRVLRV